MVEKILTMHFEDGERHHADMFCNVMFSLLDDDTVDGNDVFPPIQ